MELIEEISALSSKIKQQAESITTEEATKNAFVMPFIHKILGYDVFNPQEVIPEFTADVGTKKGEKVDYAILKDGEIKILIEAKKIGEQLSLNHASQLYRYFSVTNARVAVLTNGRIYKFYTDLEAPNKMDEKPFIELDLCDVDDYTIPEIKKLTKSFFDIESIVSSAEELKYLGQIKRMMATQFNNPDDDFVRYFASNVYSGILTQKVRDQFAILTKKALQQFLNDRINERLKTALDNSEEPTRTEKNNEETKIDDNKDNDIVTTNEEIEGFHIIRAICRSVIDIKRIYQRDTKSYFGVLIDDNNRKPICRLHFNRQQKYIGLFNTNKEETRYPLHEIDDIFKYSDQLIETAKLYLSTNER